MKAGLGCLEINGVGGLSLLPWGRGASEAAVVTGGAALPKTPLSSFPSLYSFLPNLCRDVKHAALAVRFAEIQTVF